jgi:hypothetical protein
MIRTSFKPIKDADIVKKNEVYTLMIKHGQNGFVLIPVVVEAFIESSTEKGKWITRMRELCGILCFDLSDEEVLEKLFKEVKE